MFDTKLTALFQWIASHGHRTELHNDHIALTEIVQDWDGSLIEERHKIRNLKEAREILGY